MEVQLLGTVLGIVSGTLLVTLLFFANTLDRLRRIERKLNALLRHHDVDPMQAIPLSDRVKQLAADPRNKIAAIKLFREETGAGLADAKDVIEAFINSK